MVRDPAEHVGEPGARIDVVELGRGDERSTRAPVSRSTCAIWAASVCPS